MIEALNNVGEKKQANLWQLGQRSKLVSHSF